jgi:tetratricopeptide (TPR) repeat protein
MKVFDDGPTLPLRATTNTPSGSDVRITPRGVAVTTASFRVAHLVHQFEEEVLGYGRGAAVIFDAVADDPDCGLAQGYAAAAHLFRLSLDGKAEARKAIARAGKAKIASQREALMIQSIGCWSNGNAAQAANMLRMLIAKEPRDLFAAKLLQYFQLGCGDARGMVETSSFILPHHVNDPRAHAMHAFALEQTGDIVNAEGCARQALALGPDPWAHHALAHVFDSQRRFHEGRTWMHVNADAWANCSSFLFTHNWWHAALFHIAMGDHDGALDLYHERVWTMRKDYAQDQINAISLLAHLELAGLDVGDLWLDVAEFVRPNAVGGLDGLLDLHHAYALARAGDCDVLGSLLRTIENEDITTAMPWQTICVQAAHGVAAFALGDQEDAVHRLAGVMDQLHLLGGSTVQRNLFALIYDAARGATPLQLFVELAA